MSNSLSLGKTRKSKKQTNKQKKEIKRKMVATIQYEALENTNTFKSFTLIQPASKFRNIPDFADPHLQF